MPEPIGGSVHPRRLALAGVQWPAVLEALGPELNSPEAGRRHLERNPEAELWIGYGSPSHLLLLHSKGDPAEALQRWAWQGQLALELRRTHPGRCHLLNLPLLDHAAMAELLQVDQAEAPAPPGSRDPAPQEEAELDVRLALALQHRRDLLGLYADLEGNCEMLGREPQFVLPLPALRGEALAERCLQSWSRQQADRDSIRRQGEEEVERTLLQLHEVQQELDRLLRADRHSQESIEGLRRQEQQLRSDLAEAREEAKLTLLQLHQVQEELEHTFLEHRQASQDLRALQEQLERLEQEALHLFLHATPTASLDRSRLERLSQLAREALQLSNPG